MFTGMELMACHSLAVPAEVMQHVIHVESDSNPYAIGVVGGQLVRQPQNLPEALATVHMLDAQGYNYSLGVAQINRANLGKYGLDSYEQAFDPCPNVVAGSRILATCYSSSGGDWGKAFSCYYSGNFVTGYRDGYVHKVYDSINRSAELAVGGSQAIPLKAGQSVELDRIGSASLQPPSTAAYRVALRSVVIDSAASVLVAKAASAMAGKPAPAVDMPQTRPDQAATITVPSASGPTPVAAPPPSPSASTASVFVPSVRGPNDPVASTPSAIAQATTIPSTASQPVAGDQADLRQGRDDAAFVF
jgi:type IV secretion system protein VirB1